MWHCSRGKRELHQHGGWTQVSHPAGNGSCEWEWWLGVSVWCVCVEDGYRFYPAGDGSCECVVVG